MKYFNRPGKFIQFLAESQKYNIEILLYKIMNTFYLFKRERVFDV